MQKESLPTPSDSSIHLIDQALASLTGDRDEPLELGEAEKDALVAQVEAILSADIPEEAQDSVCQMMVRFGLTSELNIAKMVVGNQLQ